MLQWAKKLLLFLKVHISELRPQFRDNTYTQNRKSEYDEDYSVGVIPINILSPHFDLDSFMMDLGPDAEFLDNLLN